MQSIYAGLLLNKVLTQGLLGTLTLESDISDKSALKLTPLNSYPNYSYIYQATEDLNTQIPSTSVNIIYRSISTNSNEPIATNENT